MKFKFILIFLLMFLGGVIAGGYLFSDTRPRSFLRMHQCNDTCLNTKELLGLLGSAGIQTLPGFTPFAVKETDKTVVIQAPVPRAPLHYVIIPKKDVRDIADLSEQDKEYLFDAYALIGELIREKNLQKYKVYTNGPGYQTVNYLHFHLLSEEKE